MSFCNDPMFHSELCMFLSFIELIFTSSSTNVVFFQFVLYCTHLTSHQTIIEEPKTPMRSRRVQTEQDPLDELRANAVKTVIKSSSLHVLRQMYNTQDTDTQTNVGDLTHL